MRKPLYTIVVVSLVLLTTGCAGIGTKTFKKFKVGEGTSISIDATQRVILVKDNVAIVNDDGVSEERQMVCAEPSPDAIVAATAQAAIAANVAGQGSAEVSGGFGQAASSMGIRTATIQLLRDGYYRACEAAMNELFTTKGYNHILHGIGPVMLGLLAIDGLTQMQPAPIVSVAASGSAATDHNGTKARNEAAIPGPGDIVSGDIEAGVNGTRAESKVETNVEPTNEVPPNAMAAIAANVVQIVKETNRALEVVRGDAN